MFCTFSTAINLRFSTLLYGTSNEGTFHSTASWMSNTRSGGRHFAHVVHVERHLAEVERYHLFHEALRHGQVTADLPIELAKI